MKTFEEKLKEVHETKKSFWTTPNEAMVFLGVHRRGWRVNETINVLLAKYDLIAEPPFEETWKWGDVEVKPKPKLAATKVAEDFIEKDPTTRLSTLKAANIANLKDTELGLVVVNRDTPIKDAVTLMLMYDFSQLPIMSGRRAEGIVSWRSIGQALALNKECKTVNDCKEEVAVLSADETLFAAVKVILQKEVVLVKGKDEGIVGIVTATDIGEQFIALAEPFLIIEQIENHIRKLLDGKFVLEQLQSSLKQRDTERKIETLSDLTFGEYVRIIENPENFEKLNLNVSRTVLVKQLEEIRQIRNDVMHFDPDGVSERELELLRQMVQFFHKINSILKKKK